MPCSTKESSSRFPSTRLHSQQREKQEEKGFFYSRHHFLLVVFVVFLQHHHYYFARAVPGEDAASYFQTQRFKLKNLNEQIDSNLTSSELLLPHSHCLFNCKPPPGAGFFLPEESRTSCSLLALWFLFFFSFFLGVFSFAVFSFRYKRSASKSSDSWDIFGGRGLICFGGFFCHHNHAHV